MTAAFRERGVPLWVAFYRRALPRFLLVRDLLRQQAIGQLTSIHVELFDRLTTGDGALVWRFDPAASAVASSQQPGSQHYNFVMRPVTLAAIAEGLQGARRKPSLGRFENV